MTTDLREQRAIVIAATCRVENKRGLYIVPSQTGDGRRYTVDPTRGICTCPDHQDAGHKCKHIRAVEIVIKRETSPDGTVTETKTITVTEKRVTYPQNWTAYNAAQSCEKDRVQELLYDLVKTVDEPEQTGKGRMSHTVRDQLFATVFKVYTTLSSRRVSSDLREAHRRGHTVRSIPGLKVNHFFENAELTPILRELVGRSCLPLRAVETEFAIDSSGFSTCTYERWYDEKYGAARKRSDWVKVHIATGVKTNCITAVRVLGKDSGDAPQFIPLVKETAKGFQINEVSADKAYPSMENFEAVAECGGTAFIAFKTNATGACGGILQKMFHYFSLHTETYMARYHKRSNVESTFSAVKRKFGAAVRSKTKVAIENEILCKCIAQNLCCLIQEQHELGIATSFSSLPALPRSVNSDKMNTSGNLIALGQLVAESSVSS